MIRQRLGIDVRRWEYGHTAVVSNVLAGKPHANIAYERFTPQGPLAILPLPGNVNPAALQDQANEQKIRRQIAIINSMTPGERQFPKTINGSRKKRIAAGAGLQIQDVNRLLKQFGQMQRMMKKFGKGGMKGMMRKMAAMKGQMPPGGFR